MGIETRNKTIDGVRYTVTQFPARRGFQLKIRLARLLAPALGPTLGGFEAAKLAKLVDADINPGMVGKGFAALFESADPDDIMDLVMTLLSDTRRDGHEIDEALFDREFAANYGHLYKVLAFVLEVNYSNLLRVGGGLASIMRQSGEGAVENTEPQSSASPTGSTGS